MILQPLKVDVGVKEKVKVLDILKFVQTTKIYSFSKQWFFIFSLAFLGILLQYS